MFKYFDAHSHLNFSQFDEDREEIIKEMNSQGIATICVGTDEKTSMESLELARKHGNIWATIGLHPTDTDEDFNEDYYQSLIEDRVVGVGECGLDYYRDRGEENGERSKQKKIFNHQIEFALKNDLPLMLHMRPSTGSMDAYNEGIDMLSSFHSRYGEKLKGNAHFFVGDTDIAKKLLNIGFTMSFDGPITFTEEYNDVIRYIPLDMMFAETDAPFAAPAPFRGRRNSPLYVGHIVEKIAQIKGENLDLVQKTLVENVLHRFNLCRGFVES